MPYPRGEKERVQYWVRQIDHAAGQLKAPFLAAETLIKQYENAAASDREREQEDEYVESHVSRVKANLIFGWVDQSIANLAERNPTFRILPQNKGSMGGASVVSSISNYWYRETNQLKQDQQVLLDAFLTPYGVKKLGWTTDLEERVQEMVAEEGHFDFGDDIESETLFLLGGEETMVTNEHDHVLHIEAHTQALQQPELDVGIIDNIQRHIERHDTIMNRAQPDQHTSIQWEAPFGIRWNPKDFIIDPLATDGLRDARWIAFRWQKPLEDVQANPNYQNTRDLEPNTRLEGAPAEDPLMKGADFGLVTGYEIWARNFPVSRNRRRNMLVVIAEGHDKLLRHEDEWPYSNIEDYPAEILCFQGSVNKWYTKPTLVMAGADNIQALVNEILDSTLSIVRKQKNLLLYDSGVIEEDTLDNMMIAPDMSAFPVPGMSSSPGAAVAPINFGNVTSDSAVLLQTINGLFDRAAGTPQPMQAAVADTATEASIHEKRTTAREARRGALLAEYQVNVARKMWQMTVQFRPERVFLINERAQEWITVSEEQAKGEYQFKIDVASHGQAIALERKQHLDQLNLFAGLAGLFQQLYGQPPNLAALAERLLTRGFGDFNPEEILPMLEKQESLPVDQQADILQKLQGGPSQPPTQGPNVAGPPREQEPGQSAGPAQPSKFNEPAPSAARTEANGRTP